MAYPYPHLNKTITLEPLREGQVINRLEYIEKLKVFKKFADEINIVTHSKPQGTYIVDNTYRGHGNQGLHYYKFDTLLRCLIEHSSNNVQISFLNGGLSLIEIK